MRGECDTCRPATTRATSAPRRRSAIKGSVLRHAGRTADARLRADQRARGAHRRALAPEPQLRYPALAQLEDEGLVRAIDDDGKKRFELTDEGRTWLDEHAGRRPAMPWERAESGGRGDLRRLAGEIFGQLRQLGRYGSPPSTTGRRRSSATPAPSSTPSCAEPPRKSETLRNPERSPHGSEPSVAAGAAGEKSIERVTVAATKRSSFGAPMNRSRPPAGGRTGAGGLFGGRPCVLTAWAWTMEAVVVSSSAWRCSA